MNDRRLLNEINRDGCDRCGVTRTIEPVYYEEHEYKTEDGRRWRTGRVRTVCSHLRCISCGHNIITDGEFLSERL